MSAGKDEVANLQMLLGSAQEKDVRLGLHLADTTQVLLPDLTRILAFSFFHQKAEIREMGLKALQSQTSPQEFELIRKNWTSTYLSGHSTYFYDAVVRIGELDRIESDELLRQAVLHNKLFPKDRLRQYPIAFLTFCEIELQRGNFLTLEGMPIPVLPKAIASWDLFLNLRELNLARCGMTRLPQQIGNLKNLQSLDLSDNSIKSLPHSIGELTSLKTLELHSNPIAVLPKSFANLKNLLDLSLDLGKKTDHSAIAGCENLMDVSFNNSLHPEPFSGLTNLTEIFGITLKVSPECESLLLPETVDNWKKLKQVTIQLHQKHPFPVFITQLEQVENVALDGPGPLSRNCTPVPQPHLKRIWIKNPDWEEWPEHWAEFEGLEAINIEGGKLSQFPSTFKNCKGLQELKIHNSPFKEFPEFLSEWKKLWSIVISSTEISEIPEEVKGLRNLKVLEINACPVRELPGFLKEMTWLEHLVLKNLKLNKPDVLELQAALPNTVVEWL